MFRLNAVQMLGLSYVNDEFINGRREKKVEKKTNARASIGN